LNLIRPDLAKPGLALRPHGFPQPPERQQAWLEAGLPGMEWRMRLGACCNASLERTAQRQPDIGNLPARKSTWTRWDRLAQQPDRPVAAQALDGTDRRGNP